jgi:putative transposase
VLKVSRAGFYKWLKPKTSKRYLRHKFLEEKIKNIHQGSRGVYGSQRIHEQLKQDGINVNRKTVENIMKENGIRAKRSKKFKATTNSRHNLPVARNLLKRNFKARRANQCWVSDITYLWTDEGWLYLATFVDLFSRMVVGWSMSSRMTADLVVSAFQMAIKKRGQSVRLMIHSDRGSQYASKVFRAELKQYRCRQSMSRKGDCWDNAVAESFFSNLKLELVHHEKFKTREEAMDKIFDYIEVFYNRQRLHSYLEFVSPEQFENAHLQAA